MKRVNWLDVILFKLGLIRKKRNTVFFIHHDGMMVAESSNTTVLESLLVFLAGYLVTKMDNKLDARIKLARATILAEETMGFIKDKIEELMQ